LIVVLTLIIINLSSMYFTFGNLFSMLYVVCSYVCLSVFFYIHRFSTSFYGPYVA